MSQRPQPLLTIHHQGRARIFAIFFFIWVIIAVVSLSLAEDTETLYALLWFFGLLSFFLGFLPAILLYLYRVEVHQEYLHVRTFLLWRKYAYTEITGYEYDSTFSTEFFYLFANQKILLSIQQLGAGSSPKEFDFLKNIMISHNIPPLYRSNNGTAKPSPVGVSLRPKKAQYILTTVVFTFLSILFIFLSIRHNTWPDPSVRLICIIFCLCSLVLIYFYLNNKIVIEDHALIRHYLFKKPKTIPYNQITSFAVKMHYQRRGQSEYHIDVYSNTKILSVSQSTKGYVALGTQLKTKNISFAFDSPLRDRLNK